MHTLLVSPQFWPTRQPVFFLILAALVWLGLGLGLAVAIVSGWWSVLLALLAKGAALGTVLAFMMSVFALLLPEMIILRYGVPSRDKVEKWLSA
jgi:hypothetical protein